MKNLLIIVATAFGRETYYLATQCKGYLKEFRIKGFLDDRTNALDNYKGYPPIISSVEDYKVQPDDIFVCALGNGTYKKHYVEIISSKGGQLIPKSVILLLFIRIQLLAMMQLLVTGVI